MPQTSAAPLDVAALVPEFAPLARTTVRLHPRRGESAANASKMGSPILWPAAEPWPRCETHGSPLVPVLQLRASDVPELGFPEGADLFQLLWCPQEHEVVPSLYGMPTPHLIWRSEATLREALPSNPVPTGVSPSLGDFAPQPCTLHPERVVEYPHAFALIDDAPELLDALTDAMDALFESLPEEAQGVVDGFDLGDEPIDLYQYWLSVAPGTKVGGYPQWDQNLEWPRCPECGGEMDYLLTIASAEFDGGSWLRWLPVEERHVWGGDPATRRAVQAAAGLMLGDMGNINVFVCRRCPGWPSLSVFQCS